LYLINIPQRPNYSFAEYLQGLADFKDDRGEVEILQPAEDLFSIAENVAFRPQSTIAA
jgi:hypothetical protein